MVFKRRKRLPITRKIREGLFPEKGWSRAAEYMMARIKRLPDSPKNISFGVAIGVFVSFSPFFVLNNSRSYAPTVDALFDIIFKALHSLFILLFSSISL